MNAKIKPQFWTDGALEAKPPEMKLTILWCMTNYMTNFAGVFSISPRRFAFETGLKAAWLERTLRELAPMFVVCGDRALLKNFIRHQYGQGPKLAANNIGRALIDLLPTLPAPMSDCIYALHPELKGLPSPSKGLPSPSKGLPSPSKGLPSPSNSNKTAVSGAVASGSDPFQPSSPSLSGGSPSEGLASPPKGKGTGERERTGTGEGECEGERPYAEAEIPTLNEVLTECLLRGIPEETGRAFFDHYEKTAHPAWTDGGGKRFQWRGKLGAWAVKARQLAGTKTPEEKNRMQQEAEAQAKNVRSPHV